MPSRCGRTVVAYCGSRCDRERGHEGMCCANRWHPSGCGNFSGVSRDYLMDVVGGLTTDQLATMPAAQSVAANAKADRS